MLVVADKAQQFGFVAPQSPVDFRGLSTGRARTPCFSCNGATSIPIVSVQVVLAWASSDVAVSASSRSVAVTVGRRLGGVSRGLAAYSRTERDQRGDAVGDGLSCNSSSARKQDVTGVREVVTLGCFSSEPVAEAGVRSLPMPCSHQAPGGE